MQIHKSWPVIAIVGLILGGPLYSAASPEPKTGEGTEGQRFLAGSLGPTFLPGSTARGAGEALVGGNQTECQLCNPKVKCVQFYEDWCACVGIPAIEPCNHVTCQISAACAPWDP